jgi:hypothetical protein
MNWTTTRFVFIAAMLAVSSVATATTIVDFKPVPTSPAIPEFGFHRPAGGGAPVFRAELGATSNGDGNLLPQNQTAGGLDSETPFVLAGPGAINDLIAGTTGFYDSSFQFTSGLAANAPALNAGGTFLQQLSPGTFQITSTTAAGGPILLLSGSVTTASVIVGAGDAGAVFDANGVSYTGGLIYNAMLAANYNVNNSSFSISMVDVNPAFSINPADGYLADFDANATGLLNANPAPPAPEPGSLTLLALGIGLVAGARQLRRR